jgi:RNA polymerase sigma-70 factor (ECF subfamily)
MQACRDYLRLVAASEISADLATKAGGSDLVQDAYLEALRDSFQFEGQDEAALRAWLRRILINNIKNKARAFRNTKKRDIHREVPIDRGDGTLLDIEGSYTSPSSAAIRSELSKILEAAMMRLSERERETVLLRSYEQYTFEKIGERLGVNGVTARDIWIRALAHLRRDIGRD